MDTFYITHPCAAVAKSMEKISLFGHNSNNKALDVGCSLLIRTIALTVLPVFIALELVFKKIPKALMAINTYQRDNQGDTQTKFSRRCDKIAKYALCLLFFPLALHSPDAISFFFLKRPPHPNEVQPFGVEKVFGKTLKEPIFEPKTEEELLEIVKYAQKEKKQISVIGSGFSQGRQTVPCQRESIAISLKHLNQVQLNENDVTAGAGATWEKIQMTLDKAGKSVIVKQASDPFSIGGSIGINCHGWAHQAGPLSNTVKEIRVINGQGEIETLKETDEDFKLYFGTLGYFGIVLSATLKIAENEYLKEVTIPAPIDKFFEEYKKFENDPNVPLFGGRLSLDAVGDNIPLQEVYLESFRKTEKSDVKPTYIPEWKKGTRFQRIFLHLQSNFTNPTAQRLIKFYWEKEKKSMTAGNVWTRNDALHPAINAFEMYRPSDLRAQWLQEYFIKPEKLVDFLKFLGPVLKENKVRLLNATIRPTPEDTHSILPYATKGGRMAVVLSFEQFKSQEEITKTKAWIKKVNQYLTENEGIYYQAYMPWATNEQFETCYGKENIEKMRKLKQQKDPNHLFGNAHTRRYFDATN